MPRAKKNTYTDAELEKLVQDRMLAHLAGQPIPPPTNKQVAAADLKAGVVTFQGGKPANPLLPLPQSLSDQATKLKEADEGMPRVEIDNDDPTTKALLAAQRGESYDSDDGLKAALRRGKEQIENRLGPGSSKDWRFAAQTKAMVDVEGQRGYIPLVDEKGNPIKFADAQIAAMPAARVAEADRAAMRMHEQITGEIFQQTPNGTIIAPKERVDTKTGIGLQRYGDTNDADPVRWE